MGGYMCLSIGVLGYDSVRMVYTGGCVWLWNGKVKVHSQTELGWLIRVVLRRS